MAKLGPLHQDTMQESLEKDHPMIEN